MRKSFSTPSIPLCETIHFSISLVRSSPASMTGLNRRRRARQGPRRGARRCRILVRTPPDRPACARGWPSGNRLQGGRELHRRTGRPGRRRPVPCRLDLAILARRRRDREDAFREDACAVRLSPNSITQSNYWLGKALSALGDKDEANAAYQLAAAYHTEYYGQLARHELGETGSGLRRLPAWHAAETEFDKLELVRAARLLAANGEPRRAVPLVRQLAQSLRDGGQLLLAARLAQSIGAHDLAILIADIADKRGVALDPFSFPKDGLPRTPDLAAIDLAAIYAVARQETSSMPAPSRALARAG